MSNYSRFSGFQEGARLPPNTYVCVIESERPALGGRKVKGERGVAYKMRDDPGRVYVIGDGWYWRGPVVETKKFVVPNNKPQYIKLEDTILGESLVDMLKQSITQPTVYNYQYGGGVLLGSSSYLSVPISYKVVPPTQPMYQPAVPKGPPPKIARKTGR